MTAFQGRCEDVKEALAEAGIKYGISIGRRAPMHKVHVDCLHEIAAAGLKVVIFIGSTNGPDSPLFDPVRNPMTVEQQKAQLKLAVPEYYVERRILTLDDLGHQEKWFDAFFRIVDETCFAGQSAVHYRVKAADAKPAGGQIKPLSAYMGNFMQRGISAWESFNRDHADDDINASDIRLYDLDNLTQAQRDVMAAPDFVIELARKARGANPDKAQLEKAGVPLTVFDLALERMRLEAGISTAEILAVSATPDIKGMSGACKTLHKQKYFPDPEIIDKAPQPLRRMP